MSNSPTKNLANLAAALDDGTSGQVLQSTGSGGVQFADSTGSGVTVHANQAAMLTDAASASEGSLHYETGTNKLYVKQSSGFYLLASITNVAPTIDSFSEATGGASANNLTAGGTFTLTSGSNTVITINATEPDLETISYSATVTSGTATNVFSSPSFPVTNQSSNVFTLTPVTSGTGGTVTIRFDASDGTNVANVSHSFEIAFSIADSHFSSLLMSTDGSAGDNDTITYDTGSTTGNSFTSIATNHSAGTFSPYRHGGYSTYFDGSGDFLTAGSSGIINFGTGDFTVEFYINTTAGTGAGAVNILNPSTSTGSGYWGLLLQNNKLRWNNSYNVSNLWEVDVSNELDGSWHHMSVVRSSGTFSVYVDGTSKSAASGTFTDSTNYSGDEAIRIGEGNASDFTGYLSDVRIVKGTAITPPSGGPTERLTAVTNTSLLTCHLPYISDGSSSAHSITVNGNTSTKPFGPYDNSEYNESINGGSILIDATNKLIQLDDSSGDFALGTTETTIKLWYYPMDADATTTQYLIRKGTNASASGYWALGHYSSNRLRTMTRDNGGSWLATYSSNNVITPNTWNYIEWYQPTSGNGSAKVNGTEVISTSTSSNYGSTTETIRLPQTAQNPTNGLYYADLQFVKGDARESSVPTAPMSTDSNSALHIKGTDASILDKAQSNNFELSNNIAPTSVLTSSTTPAYIGANWANKRAISFGNSSGNSARTRSFLPINEGSYTVEGWINMNSSSGTHTFFDTRVFDPATNSNAGFYMMWRTDSGNYFRVGSSDGIYLNNIGSGDSLSTGTWYHFALVRDASQSSNNTAFFIGGIRKSQMHDTRNKTSDQATIGSNYSNSSIMDGYLQDFRVSHKARYDVTSSDVSSSIPSSPLKG